MTPFLFPLLIVLGQAAPGAGPAQPQPQTAPAPAPAPPPAAPLRTEAGEDGELPVMESRPTTVPAETPLDTLTRAPTVRPFQMPAMTPLAPVPYAPPAQAIPSQPVPVEQYRRSYEGPADPNEQYYERGVQGAFQAEQSMMGALDGQWTLAAADGQPIYAFIVNDPPGGGAIEAAWRDLRAGSGPRSLGVVDVARREGQGLFLQFHEGDRIEPVVLRLRREPDGRWRGDLDEAGQKQAVTLAKS